jgi:hypothetical protein
MDTVDYVKTTDVAATMVETAKRKTGLLRCDLLIRGMLSGAILGGRHQPCLYRRGIDRFGGCAP